MKAQGVEGKLVGTFNGRAGKQFGLIGTKIDLLLRDSYVDEETGERVYELTLRAHKAVDEFRMQLELPEHGWERLVEEIEEEREA
jgi:hypothetical protein